MVSGAYEDYVRRKAINLEQKCRNYAFYLTGLMLVSSLFSDGVHLIKKEYASASSGELEYMIEASCGLAKKTGDETFVANYIEREHQIRRERFGHARLAVAWRPGQ